MNNKNDQRKAEPAVPRLNDLSRMIETFKKKQGVTFFGMAPISAPALNLQEVREQTEQAVQSLPLDENQKGLVKKLIVHFSSLVAQVDASFVKGLAQMFVRGIIDIPGYKPEAPKPGRRLST